MAKDLHTQQIVAAYEDCNLTAEEIAAEYELELPLVKVALQNSSNKYRSAMSRELNSATGEDPLDLAATGCLRLTEDELTEFHDGIKDIARESEQDYLKFSASKFLINEHHGHHKPAKNAVQQAGTQINLLQMTVNTVNKQISELKASKPLELGMPTLSAVVDTEESE
jgi:hypothetical protein